VSDAEGGATDVAGLCGVCGVVARPGARFCGRCGAETGVMIARDAGAAVVHAPAPRASARPDFGRGLSVALGCYGAIAIAGMIMLRINPLAHRDAAAAATAAIGLAGAVGLVVLGRDVDRGAARWRWTGAAAVIVSVAAAAAALVILGRLTAPLLADPWTGLRAWARPGPEAAGVVALGALADELAFRGAILGGLRRCLSDRAAIVASAALFAIAQGALVGTPVLFGLGLVLATVRVRTGRLWPSVIAHAAAAIAVALI
jgi:membrane protease YdiL (CAAX protease family)